MEDNYSLLIRKIDEFIRKYYKNRMIRGSLYSVAWIMAAFLIADLLEYYAYFNTRTRTIIFCLFLLLSLTCLVNFIVVPLLKLFKIGKVITHEQAAEIIGKHFPGVKDSLLNTLQLKQLSDTNTLSRDLILASIRQKSEKLRPFRFSLAIDPKRNLKYLRYALPPLILFLGILLIAPSLITSPTRRIVNFQTVFEKPLKYHIYILNSPLQVQQQNDFTLNVKVIGDEIPDQLSVSTSDADFIMNKTGTVNFTHTFRNLQKDLDFKIRTEDYETMNYTLRVLPKPIILSYSVALIYPAYLGKKPEKLENTGDMTVPEGTFITWKFTTKDTRMLSVKAGSGKSLTVRCNGNSGLFSLRLKKTTNITLVARNEYFSNSDSLSYYLNVVPDQYPEILTEEHRDSLYSSRLYFNGVIRDDYGFKKLTFNYQVEKADTTIDKPVLISEGISIDKQLSQQPYFYFLDISKLKIKPGETLHYFFEVWDNDGVNGSKSSRSAIRTFEVPTPVEIDKELDQKGKSIVDKMQEAIQQAQKLKKQIAEYDKSLIDKKSIGWQEKKQLQELMDNQHALSDNIEEIKKENVLKNIEENLFLEQNQAIIEKNQELQRLFNEILPDEVKKMVEELQKMMEQIDRDKIKEALGKMKMSSEDLQKQLERNLQLFKQLEFEKKLQDAADKADTLGEEQDKLSGNTAGNRKEESSKLSQDQEKIKDKFSDLQKNIDELENKNKELEEPNEFENTGDLEKEINKLMEEALKNIENKKMTEAGKGQKKASEKLKQLGQKLRNALEKMKEEANEEDMDALREILENLIHISFNQENIITLVANTATWNPKYVKLIEEQKKLNDDLQMVEDSLQSLGKRQMTIAPFVSRELAVLKNNSSEAVEALNERSGSVAQSKQQYIMTSVNNLALMLSEVLQNLQNENNSQSGAGKMKVKSKKPGSGSEQMKSLRQLQEQMGKQLQQLKEGLEKGNSGQKSRNSSEQLARLAAQQEAVRRQMQNLGEEFQKEGSGVDKTIKEMMRDMEQTETELVNKRISQQTIQRQQQIVTRMLESEKALQKQEEENRRESTEGRDTFNGYNNDLIEFKRKKSKELELLKTAPAELNTFYRLKSNKYFMILE